jgi:hypothetical protein
MEDDRTGLAGTRYLYLRVTYVLSMLAVSAVPNCSIFYFASQRRSPKQQKTKLGPYLLGNLLYID